MGDGLWASSGQKDELTVCREELRVISRLNTGVDNENPDPVANVVRSTTSQPTHVMPVRLGSVKAPWSWFGLAGSWFYLLLETKIKINFTF